VIVSVLLYLSNRKTHAEVVKLADALDSKSSGATRVGSSPTSGTKTFKVFLEGLFY
jgi:hypothetical protein